MNEPKPTKNSLKPATMLPKKSIEELAAASLSAVIRPPSPSNNGVKPTTDEAPRAQNTFGSSK